MPGWSSATGAPQGLGEGGGVAGRGRAGRRRREAGRGWAPILPLAGSRHPARACHPHPPPPRAHPLCPPPCSHWGGINYPVGGTGVLAEKLATGLAAAGGEVRYGVRVTGIETDASGRAVGVRTADGGTVRAKTVISNATRWDTFGRLLPEEGVPAPERAFRERYVKAPSFFSIHMLVQADALPPGTECHHIVLEDWGQLDAARGTLFVSIPSLLDPSLCPPGTHVFHAFTPDWVDAWKVGREGGREGGGWVGRGGRCTAHAVRPARCTPCVRPAQRGPRLHPKPFQGLGPAEYEAAKEEVTNAIVARLEAAAFPGLAAATLQRDAGTPRTHRRFLARADGTYGPIPSRRLPGMLGMPMNTTAVPGLYCAGDSTFPGQGVNAVVFSGVGCAHRVAADLGLVRTLPAALDRGFRGLLDYVRGRT